jgi:hypothetical protein
MSKTTHYELNTPIGSEVLSVMTGLNPNFTAIDGVMYDNETRSTQALNKANVNEQNIATALGRITTAEGDIDTLESGLETANTNISGLTSRMTTAESGLVSANNRIQENTNQITQINADLTESHKHEISENTRVDLAKQHYYTTPADGYFKIGFNADSLSNEYVYGYINSILCITENTPTNSTEYGLMENSIFVRKGTVISFDGSTHAIGSFYPLG